MRVGPVEVGLIIVMAVVLTGIIALFFRAPALLAFIVSLLMGGPGGRRKR